MQRFGAASWQREACSVEIEFHGAIWGPLAESRNSLLAQELYRRKSGLGLMVVKPFAELVRVEGQAEIGL